VIKVYIKMLRILLGIRFML